jgi:hypothetical protein
LTRDTRRESNSEEVESYEKKKKWRCTTAGDDVEEGDVVGSDGVDNDDVVNSGGG